MSIVIALDGPAGSGKSSVAKEIANRLKLTYLDTGAMYRAFTYYLIKNSIRDSDKTEILEALDKVNIDLKDDKIFLNSEDVSKRIRERDVTNLVSSISKIKEVREKLVNWQRECSEEKDVILDGRDIGTIVFPNADLKIFLNASVEERARRRYKDFIDSGVNVEFEEVKEEIKKRDDMDYNRKESPLKKAEDAIEIDTSNLSIQEVINEIVGLVKGIEHYS